MSPTVPNGVVDALLHHRPEPRIVIRMARTAQKWSQAELGRRCGYSASQVSRWETGRLPLRDVGLLRTLAEVLGLPPAVFGLADEDTAGRGSRPVASAGHRVGRATIPQAEEPDPVRRRAFLQLTAVTGTALAWPGTATALRAEGDPAAALAYQLGDVLLGPIQAAPAAPIGVLQAALAAARRAFTACRYLPLAQHLPMLLAAAEATAVDQADATHWHRWSAALPAGALLAREAGRTIDAEGKPARHERVFDTTGSRRLTLQRDVRRSTDQA